MGNYEKVLYYIYPENNRQDIVLWQRRFMINHELTDIQEDVMSVNLIYSIIKGDSTPKKTEHIYF